MKEKSDYEKILAVRASSSDAAFAMKDVMETVRLSVPTYFALQDSAYEFVKAVSLTDFQAAAEMCNIFNKVEPPLHCRNFWAPKTRLYSTCRKLCAPVMGYKLERFDQELFTTLSKALLAAEPESKKEKTLIYGINELLAGYEGDDPNKWPITQKETEGLRGQTSRFYFDAPEHLKRQALAWHLWEVSKSLTKAEKTFPDCSGFLGYQSIAELLVRKAEGANRENASTRDLKSNVLDLWERVVRFWYKGEASYDEPSFGSLPHLYSCKRNPVLAERAKALLQELPGRQP